MTVNSEPNAILVLADLAEQLLSQRLVVVGDRLQQGDKGCHRALHRLVLGLAVDQVGLRDGLAQSNRIVAVKLGLLTSLHAWQQTRSTM